MVDGIFSGSAHTNNFDACKCFYFWGDLWHMGMGLKWLKIKLSWVHNSRKAFKKKSLDEQAHMVRRFMGRDGRFRAFMAKIS